MSRFVRAEPFGRLVLHMFVEKSSYIDPRQREIGNAATLFRGLGKAESKSITRLAYKHGVVYT
jgi:hypothetical protein